MFDIQLIDLIEVEDDIKQLHMEYKNQNGISIRSD